MLERFPENRFANLPVYQSDRGRSRADTDENGVGPQSGVRGELAPDFKRLVAPCALKFAADDADGTDHRGFLQKNRAPFLKKSAKIGCIRVISGES